MNSIEKMIKAIQTINPNAIFLIREVTDVTLDGVVIEWLEGTTPISKEDIKEEMDKI